MIGHMRNRRTDRYALLLLLIVLTIGSIAASDAGTWGRVVTMILISATLLLALRTSNARPITIRIALVLALIGITSALVSAISGGGETVDWVTNAMAVMLAAVVPFAIAREIWRHPKVTPETVMGALCIYLLLGVMFALGFAIVADVGDDPYFVQTAEPNAADYVYFSYVTMATVGYGDLTARSSLGRMAAALEGLVGQLYLVTVVALLVSNLGHERHFGKADAPDDDSS
jgi:RsiW-degrading membrane proteinase PrsW (M82 family)